MNTNKFIFLFAFFTIFSFLSCENEPVDPDFLVEVPSICDEPSLFTVSSFINGNTVRIDWDKASGDAWEIQYGINGFVIGTGITVNFTNTSSLISGLTDTISYQFYIRTKCANSKYSVWVGPVSPGSSVTSCAIPMNVTAVRSLTDTSMATVAWTVNGDENSWQVEYGNHGFVLGSGTILASLSPTKTISSLLENVSYDFYVRSNCDANQNSGWVGPVIVNAVGVLGCTTPTNLAVVRNATLTSQVNVSWTAGGSETSWEIQYGNIGFAVGTGTSSVATTNPKIITGLQATSYDFYIRAKCSATQNSSWLGPINMVAAGVIDNSPALMTANIAGIQYNNMKPYLYSFSNIDITVINRDPLVGELSYLQVQGVTSDNIASSHQLNLYIPSNLWALGTYPLYDAINFETADYCQLLLLTNYGANPVTNNVLISGAVTITEFNLVTRRIKGTFSFSYEKSEDGVLVGEFQVTNGTFNYALDDSYFD